MNRREDILTRYAFMIFFASLVNPTLPLHSSTSQALTRDKKIYESTQDAELGKLQTTTDQRIQHQGEVKFMHNCSKPSIDDFPNDFMTQYQRQKQGGVLIHFLLAIYMFGALALVCDGYFIPSLEQISKKLQVSSDVAGATFMAAGSSVPELFTSIIGVFITNNDIGLGTVVGSVVFNILFIVAVCGLFASTALRLRPWPLMRDGSCYLLSIAALVAVTYDKKVYWYEALVLVTMYLLYVVIMYFNPTLESCFETFTGTDTENTNVEEGADEQTSLLIDDHENSTQLSILSNPEEENENEEGNKIINQFDHSPFSVPQGILLKTLWVLALPVTCLFYVTIPDCRKERWEKWYVVSFLISLTWSGLFTYVLVWMVSIIGFTLGVPDVIMGLTFLAAGSSGPEVISSLIVARQGDCAMAVSNSIGSNVFDILLCLGLPWLLKTSIVDHGGYVAVQDGGMIYASICLIGAVLVFVLLIKMNRWYLNKCLGIAFLIFYLVFIAVLILFAYLFGGDSLPTCGT